MKIPSELSGETLLRTTDGCQWDNENFVTEHTCEKTYPKAQLAHKVERRHKVDKIK